MEAYVIRIVSFNSYGVVLWCHMSIVVSQTNQSAGERSERPGPVHLG